VTGGAGYLKGHGGVITGGACYCKMKGYRLRQGVQVILSHRL
jgi:hypothetical protein